MRAFRACRAFCALSGHSVAGSWRSPSSADFASGFLPTKRLNGSSGLVAASTTSCSFVSRRRQHGDVGRIPEGQLEFVVAAKTRRRRAVDELQLGPVARQYYARTEGLGVLPSEQLVELLAAASGRRAQVVLGSSLAHARARWAGTGAPSTAACPSASRR